MKLLLLIGVVILCMHTKVTFNDRKLVIEVDFNRVVGKIKEFANKL